MNDAYIMWHDAFILGVSEENQSISTYYAPLRNLSSGDGPRLVGFLSARSPCLSSYSLVQPSWSQCPNIFTVGAGRPGIVSICTIKFSFKYQSSQRSMLHPRDGTKRSEFYERFNQRPE